MLRIRRYRAPDREQVRALHERALQAVGASLGPGPWDEDLDRVEEVYLEGGGEFLVGLLGDRIVAMGALQRLGPGRGKIRRMRVDPELWRRGFGQAILSALERRAAELGLPTLVLSTAVRQVAARKLYAANGYAETGRRVVGPFRVIDYEKCLAPQSCGRPESR
jgi:ribosomal protein S18 acetylase RimI-like enzyme